MIKISSTWLRANEVNAGIMMRHMRHSIRDLRLRCILTSTIRENPYPPTASVHVSPIIHQKKHTGSYMQPLMESNGCDLMKRNTIRGFSFQPTRCRQVSAREWKKTTAHVWSAVSWNRRSPKPCMPDAWQRLIGPFHRSSTHFPVPMRTTFVTHESQLRWLTSIGPAPHNATWQAAIGSTMS